MKPFGPSTYQETVREVAAGWGGAPIAWLDKPEHGTPNPLRLQPRRSSPGRSPSRPPRRVRRVAAARAGRRRVRSRPRAPTRDLDDDEAARRRRLGHRDRASSSRRPVRSATTRSTCRCPANLSATALLRLSEDPEGFARDLARPMPRPPQPGRDGSGRCSTPGSRTGSASSRCSTPTTCLAALTSTSTTTPTSTR